MYPVKSGNVLKVETCLHDFFPNIIIYVRATCFGRGGPGGQDVCLGPLEMKQLTVSVDEVIQN